MDAKSQHDESASCDASRAYQSVRDDVDHEAAEQHVFDLIDGLPADEREDVAEAVQLRYAHWAQELPRIPWADLAFAVAIVLTEVLLIVRAAHDFDGFTVALTVAFAAVLARPYVQNFVRTVRAVRNAARRVAE